MPVIGVNITKINAERSKPITGPVEIKTNTNIKGVEDIDMKEFNKKALKVGYEYVVDYVDDKKEQHGKIVLSGDVFFMDPSENNAVIDEWKNTKKLPKLVNLEILNAILRRCVIKTMSISEDVQLLPPIAIPYAKEQDNQ
jgi:hypothetical protein